MFNAVRSARAYKVALLAGALLVGGGLAGGCTKEEASPAPPITVGQKKAEEAPVSVGVPQFQVEGSPYEEGESLLALYYQSQLDPKEVEAVRKGIEEFVPNYTREQLDEATQAIMCYQYVVYHPTKLHNLLQNHKVARQVERQLRELCQLLEVPFIPIWAIVSWENSGDTTKVSYANAAGLGQMTPGAVEMAHDYGRYLAAQWRNEAAHIKASGERLDLARAERLEKAARLADCAERHQQLARDNKVEDERLVLACNLEDSVLFFKYLLSKYGGRIDLAVSAYHNGVVNNDDILYEYLRQVHKWNLSGDLDPNRVGLLEALERYNITYLDLWNNKQTREMLCGLRTVYGDKVNSDNAHLALGDESDLYLWKVMASYVGLEAGEEFVSSLQERYTPSLDFCAVRGLPAYETAAAWKEGLAADRLFAIDPSPYRDLGVAGYDPEKLAQEQAKAQQEAQAKAQKAKAKAKKKGADKKAKGKEAAPEEAAQPIVELKPPVSEEAIQLSWYATPELAGYLAQLQARFVKASGNPRVRLPLQTISGAWANEVKEAEPCAAGSLATHQRGVAVDLALQTLPAMHRPILERLIVEDFLLDVVFMRRTPQGGLHVVLNPRCGRDFLLSFVDLVSSEGKIARAMRDSLARQRAEEQEKARRAAARAAEAKENSPRSAREKALEERLEAERRLQELEARRAADSRASAVKKRQAQPTRSDSLGSQEEEKESLSSEEEELFAIPEEEVERLPGGEDRRESDIYDF